MRGWVSGLVVGLLLALAGTAAAQIPNLPPVPTVEPLPPLPKVPSLPNPVPTAVPTVQAPKLPLPQPTVPVPSVPLPTGSGASPQPSSSTPSSSTGSSGAAQPRQTSASAPRPTSADSTQPSGRAATGGATEAARSGSSSGRPSSGRPGTTATAGTAVTGTQTPADASRRRAAKRRRFLATVHRLSSCLVELPRIYARVLALRAGVGRAEPASVSATARRVDRSHRAVRRIERRGLHKLRLAARDGCETPAVDGSGADVAAATGAASGLATGRGTPATGEATDALDTADSAEVDSGEPARSDVKGAQRSHRPRFPAAILPGAPSVKFPLPLVLIPVLTMLVCAGIALKRHLRYTRGWGT